MKHDELLGLLNAKSDSDEVHALRAVVELHKPDKEGFCAVYCVEMDDDGCAWTLCAYPCTTIQAIEEVVK